MAVAVAVIVAALVNGNDTVVVIDTVDDQGSISLVSIANDPLEQLCAARVVLSVDQVVDSHDIEVCGGPRRAAGDRVVLGLR